MNRKESDKLDDSLKNLKDKLQRGMAAEFLMERTMMHIILPKREFEKWIAEKETKVLDALFSALSENIALFDILSPALMMGCMPRGVIISVKLNDRKDWDDKKDRIEEQLDKMFGIVDKNWDEMVAKGEAPPRPKPETKTARSVHINID